MATNSEQVRKEALAELARRELARRQKVRLAELIASNPAEYDPTSPEFQDKHGPTVGMGTVDKLRAGFGKAFVDLGRGARQLERAVPRGWARNIAGGSVGQEQRRTLSDLIVDQPATPDPLAREVALARQRDAPLMSTGAGLAGNIAGNIAAAVPAMAIPGAATVPGAAAVGAAIGALQPTVTEGERLGNIAVGGIFGGASQKLFNVGGKLVSRYVANRRLAKNAAQVAALKEQLRAGLRAAGASDDDISAGIRELDTQFFDSGVVDDPVAAARAAQARELGVELTPGQAEQSVTRQGREVALSRGTEGEKAARTAQEGFELQQEQLADAAARIQGRFGGRVAERGQGAAIVGTAIREQAQAAKSGVRQAYELAKSVDAFSSPPAVRQLADRGRASLIDEGFDIGGMPSVQNRLKELDELQNFAQMAAQQRRTKARIPLRELEQWRKRINANITRNADQPQDAALISLKRQYDEWIANQLDEDLLSGSPEALSLWKQARDARTTYARLFETERAIKDIVRRNPTPEEMKNWLIGASAIGAKAGAGRVASRVAEIVGKDSPAWRALKEEVFVDLLRNQPASGFSAQKFVSAVDKFVGNNPTLAKELFTKSEMEAIRALRDVAEMTIPMPGAVNFSNTSYALMRALGERGNAILNTLPFVGALARTGREEFAAIVARKAFEGYTPPPRLMFKPVALSAPAVGAAYSVLEPSQ